MAIPNKSIDFLNFADKHILYFDNCCTNICNCKDIKQAKAELNNMYQHLKDITHEYLENDHLSMKYRYLKQSLLTCESSLPKGFIIDSSPDFSFDMMAKKLPDNADFYYRRYLCSKTSENINNADFANLCKVASKKVNRLCKKIGLNSKQITIYPGYNKDYKLYDGSGFHYLSLVSDEYNSAYIDCTYRQFFTSVHNNINRIGLIELSGCLAGVFMTMTEERLKLANDILKKGWFLATPENIKNYFDGFALSYRNGLYYQETNDYSYTTNYKAEDYIRFLNGEDSQINHESIENLGFQRSLKPTKK